MFGDSPSHRVAVFIFPLAVERLSLYFISFIAFASFPVSTSSQFIPLSSPLSLSALTDMLFLLYK